MAKHPVPKRRQSKRRSATRYGKYVLETTKKMINKINLINCPKCGQKTRAHHACSTCGTYRGRQVINMGKSSEKVTKVKA